MQINSLPRLRSAPQTRHHPDDQSGNPPTNSRYFVRTVNDADIRRLRDG